MKQVRLGKTNLEVSEVGLGGIPIIQLSLEEGISLVRYAYDRGIRFVDTAHAYGDSEEKIGLALEPVRDHVVIATKSMKRDATTVADHITKSLKNLKTSYIDIYQIHDIASEETLNEVLAPGGAYEAIDQARSEGKVRFIGFSSHDIKTAITACHTGLFSTIQLPFNFIEDEAAEELFVTARELDLGMIAMKPLGGGLLERAHLCFRFLQQYTDVVPIPGLSFRHEVDEIVELYERPAKLTGKDWKEIETIRGELGKTFCHRCGYCMPCEQGVKISAGMIFKSRMKRLAPADLVTLDKTAMESIESCTACGRCIEKCPYNLPIPDVLREHLDLYREIARRYNT